MWVIRARTAYMSHSGCFWPAIQTASGSAATAPDDRGILLRFLDGAGIEPTNNRAEPALRGTVIARNVSSCSKTASGADMFSAFTSVIRTLASARWGLVGGGWSVRCVQRRACPRPLHLNLSPRPDSVNQSRTLHGRLDLVQTVKCAGPASSHMSVETLLRWK